VDVPFDPSQFNFTRVQDVEILLHLKGEDGDPNNVVIINISPLEFGNSLLVPSVKECIAQRITLPGLTLLMHVMLLSSDAYVPCQLHDRGQQVHSFVTLRCTRLNCFQESSLGFQ
jgi:hypothetical protein